jgi:rod shape-determining protein MreC
VLGVLIVLGVFLGQWQTRARKAGHSDPVTAAFRVAVEPAARTVGSLASWVGDFSAGITHASSLAAENRRLRVQASALALYNEHIQDLEQEIVSLQKLQGLSLPPERTRVPAVVIGVFPGENRITISVGASEGITSGLPVLAGEGLLGLVQTVESHTSQVTLVWSPPPFKMGAIVVHNPPSAGLLHGESWDRLVLDLGINSPVQTGDLVITSGFSQKIPRGIPIGRVVQVQQDRDFGTERVQVFPNVQLGEVREVLVLR